MLKAWEHFKTITKHRHQVIKHCYKAGILFQGLFHDLSKYSPEEFIVGAQYYTGTRSPNEGERAEKGYSKAWMHHKGRNRHHFEFWTDYSQKVIPGQPPVVPVQMPRKYVAEMLMDRIAASKIYLKGAYTQHEPLKYFERGRSRQLMHPQTAKELKCMLKILDKRGERELFRFVRDYYLKGYPM